jgi:DNA-binding NarL/FixJ family response regulator
VEQLGAGSRADSVQTLPQLVLNLIRTHVNRRLTASPDSARPSGGCLLTPSYTRPLQSTECGLVDDPAEEGVRLPGLMPTPTVRLTRREREVLRLAAEGYTTREIAQKL